MRIYWPTRVDRQVGQVVGWRRGDDLVVAAVVQESTNLNDDLTVLGRAGATDSKLGVWIDDSGLPIASCDSTTEIVVYEPPESSRLRFFTLPTSTNVACQRLSGQDLYSSFKPSDSHVEEILPLLNRVADVQSRLKGREGLTNQVIVTSALQEPNASSESGSPLILRIAAHSAAARQLLLRLGQLVEAPKRFRRTRPDPHVPIIVRSQRYMKFWNIVWLVLNDLILGYCARQLLLHSSFFLSVYLIHVVEYSIDLPLKALEWLNDWPIGLKLNTPLSSFFSTSLGLLIQTWAEFVLLIDEISPHLLKFVALASLGGLTMTIALMQDLLSLLSLHLRCCYHLTNLVITWQMKSLGGLWNLFRGKRWNVLRQRTDSYAYEVDQLFLGTLLFTVSTFLLPTVAIYAGLFYLIHILIKAIDRALDLVVTALNAFPLFELMLRLKEPSRLPESTKLQLACTKIPKNPKDLPESAYPIYHYIYLQNSPLSYTDILRPRKNR